jgi:nitric oxide reductase subunit B
MKNNQRLWRWLGLIFILSFGALGFLGYQIYLSAPPIPQSVVSADGDVIFTGEQVQRGQQAWLSAGGQQLGTVWGHGSYVAPDWSADWLHREALALRDIRAHELRKDPSTLSAAEQGGVDAALKEEMRRNTYDEATGTIKVSAARAQAIRQVAAHI